MRQPQSSKQAVLRAPEPSPGHFIRLASTLPSISGSSKAQLSSSTSGDKGKGRGIRKPSERELPVRKQFLFEQYKQILSQTPVVVFLKPGDFTVAEITKLRVDLSLIGASSDSKAVAPSADEINDAAAGGAGPSRPRLMFLRPGLLKPVFKQISHVPSSAVLKALEEQGGSVAVLAMDSLHPHTLKAALAAVQKLSASPNVRKLQAAAAAAAGSGPGAKAGKAAGIAAKPAAKPAASAAKTIEDRIPVISAVIEGKEIGQADLKRIAELPSMDQILAQLVGVLEMPARSIISMASRAAGQDLLRTLEGFKLGLEGSEGKQEGSTGPSQA